MTQKALELLQAAATQLSSMSISFGQAEQAAMVIRYIKAAAEEIDTKMGKKEVALKSKKGGKQDGADIKVSSEG